MRALAILSLCAGCYDLDALSRDFDAAATSFDLAQGGDGGAVDDLSIPEDGGAHDAGARWRSIASPTNEALRALAADGQTLYAVGAASTIVRIDADDSLALDSPGPGFELRGAASAGGVVWAVGDNGTILEKTDGGWSFSTVGDGTFNAAFALAADDLFVSGTAGTIYHGGAFEDSSTTTATLFGLWGSADTAVVAVGQSGTIVERIGDPPWSQRTSGTTHDLNATWGGGGKILAVGAGGVILASSDGQSWSAETSGTTSDLFAVWVGSGEAFAVGEGGLILRRSGSTWQKQLSTGPTLRAVLGRGDSDVWAVGDNGTILHYSP